VRLQGPVLRAFVTSACENNPHLIITLSGSDTLRAAKKFSIPCVF
jgi:hypothetical protein